MVQAARSGKQNIVEGSAAAGTSSKMELTLIGVARASLEELLADYKDFLRQRGLLDRLKKSLEQTFLERGGIAERMLQARLARRGESGQ